jgi:hypothetical protein
VAAPNDPAPPAPPAPPAMPPSQLPPSVVRTVVPLLVAVCGAWAARELGIDQVVLAELLGVLLATAYYVAVRLLARGRPRLGVLLGWPAEPTYLPR